MYRHRIQAEVLYGHFMDVVKIFEELNEIARARGWREATLWAPTVGRTNEIIVESEYPDLATFETESRSFLSDPEAMKLFRSASEFIVQGSSRDELLEPAPHLA